MHREYYTVLLKLAQFGQAFLSIEGKQLFISINPKTGGWSIRSKILSFCKAKESFHEIAECFLHRDRAKFFSRDNLYLKKVLDDVYLVLHTKPISQYVAFRD